MIVISLAVGFISLIAGGILFKRHSRVALGIWIILVPLSAVTFCLGVALNWGFYHTPGHVSILEGELIERPDGELVTTGGFIYQDAHTDEVIEYDNLIVPNATFYYVEGEKGYVLVEAKVVPGWYLYPGAPEGLRDKRHVFWLPVDDPNAHGVDYRPLPHFVQDINES